MSHEPRYAVVFANGQRGVTLRTMPVLLAYLRGMREELGSLALMQKVLRIPDPVERVP